jgi:twinkle protein
VHLIADTIDFDEYAKAPPDAARIKPASHWYQDVVDRFYNPETRRGTLLPWSKTHRHIAFRPGEVSIWSGINGHGKSQLLNQVALSAITQGERVCIASMEMKPARTMERMSRQAAGAREPAIPFIKTFHTWTDGKLWIYDQQGTVSSERIVGVTRYCAEELKVTHMVIDSLMKCGIAEDDYNRQKAFVDELCAHARDMSMHIHLVAHGRKTDTERREQDKFDVKGSSSITDQPDNVFIAWRNKKKEDEAVLAEPRESVMSEPDGTLRCAKQRHGEWEGKIALWFDRDSMQFVGQKNASPIIYDLEALDERLAIQGEMGGLNP